MATSAVSTTDRFYFTKEQLENTPSRKNGVDPEKEQSYRQQAATLIQDMGQRLSVSQLTINTAIVYMHRFYMFHSFNKFHRNALAPCCLFLAAKIEEQPRKLEHVIKVAHACLHRDAPPLDPKSEEYLQQAQDMIENEAILLQTLGFEITVSHPHTYVVKCIQLVRASKDLGQTSYFMATNSLHLTTLCLQYKPPVVACACIHLASKWSNWEIPRSNDGKDWWEYIDPTVNKTMLDEIAQDFLKVMEKCPNRLKRKISSVANLKGVSHSKVSKGESSKLSSTTSSTSGASSSATAHNSIDGAQNGYSYSDAVKLRNDLDGKSSHRQKTEKDKEREKEKRKESLKLKPLPVSSTVTASSAASSSASLTAMPPILPPLPPLTSKYATVTTAGQTSGSESKTTTSTAHSTSGALLSTKESSRKHKHHHHHLQDDGTPAKKHKSSHSHSQRAHSSSHRKPSGSSQSSDSSPSKSVKHSHPSASSSSHHKSASSGSSHVVKLPHPPHHSSSQASLSSSHSSHSHSSSKKPHPSSQHGSSSHKPSSHHGHGHSLSHKPLATAIQVTKKHSVNPAPMLTSSSQALAKPLTPPPPPPPSPMEFNLLSSLNTPVGFPSAEMHPPSAGQFSGQFLPSGFPPGMMPGSLMPGIMQGMVPPPPPPEPEPSSPPPPPPPPMP